MYVTKVLNKCLTRNYLQDCCYNHLSHGDYVEICSCNEPIRSGNHLTNYTKCLWLQKKPFKLNMIFMFCINTKRNKSDHPMIARHQMCSSVVRFQAELHRDYAEGGAGGGL